MRKQEFKERFMNAANTDMLDIQSYELKSMPREVFMLKGLRRLYCE